jgi:hypothetical protein
MKNRLRISIAVTSALLLLLWPPQITRSCGPQLDYEDTRVAFFLPVVSQTDNLANFYYTKHFLNFAEPARTDNYRNCTEWRAYTRNQASLAHIDTILYSTTPSQFLTAYETHKWDRLRKNSFIKWLLQKNNKQALEYVRLAKIIEATQTTYDYDWPTPTTLNYNTIISDVMKKCEGRITPFLKQRYAFQAVKLMYYERLYAIGNNVCTADGGTIDNTRLIKYFNKYLEGKNTIVTDWARLYYGLSFKDRKTRTRQLIKSFHNCDEKKVFIYNNLSGKDVAAAIPGVKDTGLLSAMHTYTCIKNPGRALPQISEIYTLTPNSPYLRLAITRELNKLEDWLLSKEVTGFYSSYQSSDYWRRDYKTTYRYYYEANIKSDKNYLKKFADFLVRIKAEGQADSNFMSLAVLHLCIISNDLVAADSIVRTLPNFKEPTLETQRQIASAYITMHIHDVNDPDIQQQLLESFNAIAKYDTPSANASEEEYWFKTCPANNILSELYLELSHCYLKKRNIVLGGLTFKKSNLVVNDYYGSKHKNNEFSYYQIDYFDKHATPADVDKLINFKNKKNKTPFEKSICPDSWPQISSLNELKGTLLTRSGRFQEALHIYNKLPPTYWETTYDFNKYIKRTNIASVGPLLPMSDNSLPDYEHVSKVTILKDIVQLQKSISLARTDSAKAALNFMMGNCYFNMTYYGKDWMMSSYGTSSHFIPGDYDDFGWAYSNMHSLDPHAEKAYYECSRAIAAYKKALNYSKKDKELSAKILLMLSLCDADAHKYRQEKSLAYKKYEPNRDNTQPYLSPYLATLKRKYNKTNSYQYSLAACPDVY